VAFQAWVIRKALPDFQVEPYLMLIDKTQKATVDGLHQFFKVKEENGRSRVEVKEGVSREDLGEQILRQVHVGELIPGMLRVNPDNLYQQTNWDNAQRQTVQIMKATGHHSHGMKWLSGFGMKK
jgi:hypothetical protein